MQARIELKRLVEILLRCHILISLQIDHATDCIRARELCIQANRLVQVSEAKCVLAALFVSGTSVCIRLGRLFQLNRFAEIRNPRRRS